MPSEYFFNGEYITQYHILEEDFVKFIEYIPLELYRTNREAIKSPKLGDLLLRIGSNVDIFFRNWLKDQRSHFNIEGLEDVSKANWGHYKKMEPTAKLSKEEVIVIQTREKLRPFKNWDTIPSDDEFWWNSYNTYKHEGEIKAANFDVVLKALAAYCILINKFPLYTKLIQYGYMPIDTEFKADFVINENIWHTKKDFVSKVFVKYDERGLLGKK